MLGVEQVSEMLGSSVKICQLAKKKKKRLTKPPTMSGPSFIKYWTHIFDKIDLAKIGCTTSSLGCVISEIIDYFVPAAMELISAMKFTYCNHGTLFHFLYLTYMYIFLKVN
jgi:hypothetical protein